MPGAILIFCPSPESCMSLSEQTRSVPQENPHSCIATLSSLQLSWGGAFPCQAVSWPCVASPQHPPQTSQPQGKGLHTAIFSETPTCGRLLSEVYVWPSPQGHPHTAISSERLACSHIPREAQTWLSPQQGPCTAISPVRPGVPLQPCQVQLRATHSGTARGRAQQPSGKIYNQTEICKHAHFMGLFETLLKASHMELRRTWQRRVM